MLNSEYLKKRTYSNEYFTDGLVSSVLNYDLRKKKIIKKIIIKNKNKKNINERENNKTKKYFRTVDCRIVSIIRYFLIIYSQEH